jgi:threonine/homoserine/homoserine lactone efflux protein
MNFLPPEHGLALLAGAAVVLLLIPGPAVLYIVARSVDQGRMAGLASSSGIAVKTGFRSWGQRCAFLVVAGGLIRNGMQSSYGGD